MEYFYPNAFLPENRQTQIAIDGAAARLWVKLSHLDVNSLGISDYNKRYFGEYLRIIQSTLRRYSYLLSWAITHTKVPLDKFVLVDYGGGSGMLSLLAKEFGVGTVIYNDIYDVSCRDARVIGQALQNEADYYVQGDIDKLIDFIKANLISCHALTSYDVIEHIYNMDEFLVKLSDLSDAPFTIVLASSANSLNPMVRKRRMKHHLEVEYEDRQKKWGHKERDALKAYLTIRKEIILAHAPSLTSTEVEQLARATRGLIEPEIKAYVETYLKNGHIPRQPDHPTNTCDPYTGNWAEHLLDIPHLEQILLAKGFRVSVLGGYFGAANPNPIKKSIASLLNLLISILKRKGLVIAPFYTIYARKGLA